MKFFYIILLLLLISLQETSQVKLRSKLLMKLKAKSKHKAYENLVKNVYKEDNTPYPIFELGQQDIPPELQQLTKYFNQPYLEKNIDDLNLHSKDVSETINRLIYFPSDKFVLKPQRLQEMDERLRLKWNIPSPKDYILSNRTNKYFPIKRFKNEQQKMYYLQANGLGNSESKADKTYRMLQNYRFSQISSENREQLKENVIKNEQFSVDIVNCWASSRFDVQFQQWYTNWFHFNGRLQSSRQQTKWHEWYGYPCKTSHLPYNHETKMWISQELNSKNLMEPIEFRGEFSQVRRIILFIVNWWIAPEELEILISTDLENWEKVKQWTKITEINNDDNYIGTQTSFSQVIDLGEGSKDRWFRAFKFHMRKPMQTSRMGFYNLEAISAQFTVMFRNNNHQNLCISKADSDFFSNGANLNVQNCVDVISMGDAREVFVIDDSFQIQSLIDEYCITTKNGIAKDENPLVLIPCSDAISLSDKREQFVVVARGKHFQMVFLDDQDFCISTFDHGKLDNALREDGMHESKVHASSTVDDSIHKPVNAIDGSDDSSWISQPGMLTANFTVILHKEISIKQVRIVWKLKPKHFQLSFMIAENIWEIFYTNKENDLGTSEIDFHLISIHGIKIDFFVPHESSTTSQGLAYGIQDIQLNRISLGLRLMPCDQSPTGDQSQNWLIDEVRFNDFDQWQQQYQYLIKKSQPNFYQMIFIYRPYAEEQLIGLEITQMLMKLIGQVIIEKDKVLLQINNAKIIRDHITNSQEILNELDIKFVQYKEALVKEDVKEDEEQIVKELPTCTGCGASKPLPSCYKIVKSTPHKKSGYYWIKPYCSEYPMRVYCELFPDDARAYAFVNLDLTDVITQPKELQSLCSDIGMEVAEITEQNFKLIKTYIQDVGVNLNTAALVPLGHDWDCNDEKIHECSEEFHSFNKKQSADITKTLIQNLDMTNLLNQAFNNMYPKDSIGLGMNPDSLIRFELGHMPLLGIVCSTNEMPGQGPSKALQIDCFTKIEANPDFDGTVGSQFEVECPPKCLDEEGAQVWGTTMFSMDSSICRAALYSGQITNLDGGEFMVVLGDYPEEFMGAEANDVQTLSKEGWVGEEEEEPIAHSFTLTDKLIICPKKEHEQDEPEESPVSSFLQLSRQEHLIGKEQARLHGLKQKKKHSHKQIDKTSFNHEHFQKIWAQVKDENRIKNQERIRKEHLDSMVKRHYESLKAQKKQEQEYENMIRKFQSNYTLSEIGPIKIGPEQQNMKQNNDDDDGFDDDISFLEVRKNSTNIQKKINKMSSFIDASSTVQNYRKNTSNNKFANLIRFMESHKTKEEGEEDEEKQKKKKEKKEKKEKNQNDDGQEEEEEEDDSDEELDQQQAPELPPDTQSLMDKADIIFASETRQISKNIKLIEDTEKLFETLIAIMGSLATGDHPSEQYKQINEAIIHSEGTQIILDQMTTQAEQTRQAVFQNYQNRLLHKLELLKWEEYKEEYFFGIDMLYEIQDSASAVNTPSVWEFTNEDLNGHKKAFVQQSTINYYQEDSSSEDEEVAGEHGGDVTDEDGLFMQGAASILLMKFKEFFDFKVHFAWMARNEGHSGFVFRYKDMFNYYYIAFSMRGIVMGKMVDGFHSTVHKMDRVFFANQWYRIWIVVNQSYFTVHTYDEDPEDPLAEIMDDLDGEEMEEIFEAEDHELSNGRMGFMVNKGRASYFDLVKIFPTKCWTEDSIKEEDYVQPKQCNRWKEAYIGDIYSRWVDQSPLDMINTEGTPVQPQWEVIKRENWQKIWKTAQMKDYAILQKQSVFEDHQTNTKGAILLQNDIHIINGVIDFDFWMYDNLGSVGLVFRQSIYSAPKFYQYPNQIY